MAFPVDIDDFSCGEFLNDTKNFRLNTIIMVFC